jgi:hypothetical protein
MTFLIGQIFKAEWAVVAPLHYIVKYLQLGSVSLCVIHRDICGPRLRSSEICGSESQALTPLAAIIQGLRTTHRA